MTNPDAPESLQDYALRTARQWLHAIHGEEAAPEGPRLNRRLTAVVGLVLIPPIALVVGTGAYFEPLWRAHYFVGILLLPLAALKLASTGYRAVRYYLRSRSFRAAGPPFLPMRLLAPVLVVSLLVVSITGVEMWLSRSQGQPWSTLHSGSAAIFIVTVGVHALYYLPLAVASSRADVTPPSSRGRVPRRAAVVGSVAFGLVVATAVATSAVFPVRHHEFRNFPAADQQAAQ